MIEYTYEDYRQIIKDLLEDNCQFRDFDERNPERGDVFLRHDVDFSLQSAKEMAEIESDMGITSTYFIQPSSPFYNTLNKTSRSIIQHIESLGHDIGLHFPIREFEFQSDEKLKMSCGRWRQILKIAGATPIQVVSFHNPPDWIIGYNMDGVTHTYEPRLFNELEYHSDSLGKWRDNPPKLSVKNPVQILVHPTLWGKLGDSVVSQIKAAQSESKKRMDEQMKEFSSLDWEGVSE